MKCPTAARDRRAFLRTSLGLLGLALLAGCVSAPPPLRVRRVGGLWPFPVPGPDFRLPFDEGLRESGYRVGEAVVVEDRSSEGKAELLPEVAAGLVGLPVDVIVTFGGTPSALAAKQATSTVPIVFLLVGDPVGSGLVASYARPGGNVTGVTNFAPETSAKRLELLREVLPGLSRVDYLWNPGNPAALPDWHETQAAAHRLGLRVRPVEARTPDEVGGALAAIAAEPPDAVISSGENIFVARQAQVLDFLATNRLPAVHQWSIDAAAGGLLAYGVDAGGVYRRGGNLVGKILDGAMPADLPVERPTRFDLAVNLKTAQALGLTIPQSILLQATHVIR